MGSWPGAAVRDAEWERMIIFPGLLQRASSLQSHTNALINTGSGPGTVIPLYLIDSTRTVLVPVLGLLHHYVD